MCSTGWIKIFYRFKQWEWYGDPNMVALFIHLLLRANYRPVRRRGILYGRGEFLTSRDELSRETGISERSVRTCLKRLQESGEIEVRATNSGTVISVLKYESYQCSDETSDQRPTSDRPTEGEKNGKIDQRNDQRSLTVIDEELDGYDARQPTSDQPNDQRPTSESEKIAEKRPVVKNIRKEYIIVYDDNAHARMRTCAKSEFLADFFHPRRRAAIDELCMNNHIDRTTLHRLVCEVITEWEVTSQPPHTDLNDAQRHLLSAVRIKLQKQRRESSTTASPQNETDRKDRLQQRRGTDPAVNSPEDYLATF